MLAMERTGTFGAAGTSAGSPPSNFSNNVALSFTLIVLLSNDAVNVEASTVEVNWLTANRVRSAKHHEAFHEPQGAAGILPAEECERSSADGTSAAPCWRHCLTRSRFMVPMHGINHVGAFHEPERRTPVRPGVLHPPRRHRAEQEFGAPFARFMVPMHSEKRKWALHEPQSAAGILPADLPEKSTAGKMPAAPSRCESRNPKDHRNPKDETADRAPARRSTFELRISSIICNSS